MDYTTQDYIEFAERSVGDAQPHLNAQTFAAIAQAKALASIDKSLSRIADALYDDTGNVAINLDMIARAMSNIG